MTPDETAHEEKSSRSYWGFVPWPSAVLVLYVLICGCSKKPPKTVTVQIPPRVTIFGEMLAKPEYSNGLAEAEKELPTDTWDDQPYRHNASKWRRIAAVGNRMFEETKPRLKEMTASNLVESFKIVPYPFGFETNNLGEAEEWVYVIGNQLIIDEIKSRPTNELVGLTKLGSSNVMPLQGPQGFGLSLAETLTEILWDLREERTNRASR
jgi:hypothetical protein